VRVVQFTTNLTRRWSSITVLSSTTPRRMGEQSSIKVFWLSATAHLSATFPALRFSEVPRSTRSTYQTAKQRPLQTPPSLETLQRAVGEPSKPGSAPEAIWVL